MNARPAPHDNILAGVSGWTMASVAFVVAVVVVLAAYWQTAFSLAWVWAHDGTYQYAFLIFPIAIWFAFSLRGKVRVAAPKPSVWGLVAVAVLVAIWYAGHALTVNLPQHFAFVAMFPALVLACWGWRALWTLKFPLAYLVVFAVPWGDSMVGPLQDITARMAVHALDWTGIPVLLNGRQIVTPSATWMVEQACSGVKFFLACTALGCLFAGLMYTKTWKRVGFVVLAAIVPIVANGLRVFFTIVIGETWGLHYATGTDHLIFGWQFFGSVLVLLLIVGWFFRDGVPPRLNLMTNPRKPRGVRTNLWWLTWCLLIAGPVAGATLATSTVADPVRLVAPAVAGWHGPHAPNGGWQPAFHGAAGKVRVAYRRGTSGAVVELFHAVYTGRPRHGHSLITYGNNVYNPVKSRILATADRAIVLAGGTRVTAHELRLANRAGERLIWYWYDIDGHRTASAVVAKLWQAWDALRGMNPHASVWALSMAVPHSADAEARSTLHEFARVVPKARAWRAVTASSAIVRSKP